LIIGRKKIRYAVKKEDLKEEVVDLIEKY